MTRADDFVTYANLSAGEVLVLNTLALAWDTGPVTPTVPLLVYDYLELEPFPSMSREQVARLYAVLSEWQESVDLDGAPTLRERDRALYRFLTQISVGASS